MKTKTNGKRLAELRAQLSATDKELFAQFVQRMALVKDIAEFKQKTGSKVLDPEQENALKAKLRAASPAGLNEYALVFLNTLLRLSREYQYDFLLATELDWPLGKVLAQARDTIPPVQTVIFPGTEQSYSARAARKLFPEAALVSVGSFAAACRQVIEENVDVAVLPLENSTAGTVAEVYLLLEKYTLYIQAALDLQISHALMGVPGATTSAIRRVASHPQALEQCSRLISGMGWETVEVKNTAFAAEMVKEKQDPALAALASPYAAEAAGLEILLPQANNIKCNQTRFIAVGRTLTLPPEAERVSLLIQTPHQAGALANALNVFADLGINLAKIQSRPVPKRPWDYSFYLDFWAKPNSRAARRALYQLDQELPLLRLLGWYEQFNENTLC